MKNLNGILKEYAVTKRMLGKTDTGINESQIDNLRKDLKSISSNNNIFYLICVAMVVLVFILSLIFIITNIANPEKIKVVFSVTGVSIMGLIVYMNKLWKEKVKTDMLLLLIGTMKKEVINAILVSLINKI